MWSAVNGCGCNACSDATEVLVRRESARGSYLPSCFLHGQESVTHVINQTIKVSTHSIVAICYIPACSVGSWLH